MLYYLTLYSKNSKLGRMPVGSASRNTCPISCVFLKNGCYAEQGPISWKWDKVDNGVLGVSFSEFLRQVKDLIGPRRIWRYGEEGDLPGTGDRISLHLMDALVAANRRRPVLCYTHKPVFDSPWAWSNREIIEDALDRGFNVNLSGNSPEHADRLADLQLAPVVTVLPRVYGRKRGKNRLWAESSGEFRDRIAGL